MQWYTVSSPEDTMSSTMRRLLPTLLLVVALMPMTESTAQSAPARHRDVSLKVARTAEDLLYAAVVESFCEHRGALAAGRRHHGLAAGTG